MVTVNFNGIIQAVQLTSSNRQEVIDSLNKKKIPCDKSEFGICIYDRRKVLRKDGTWYRLDCNSFDVDITDWIIILPFTSKRVRECFKVLDKDFNKIFKDGN
jgi:hypothetical protein